MRFIHAVALSLFLLQSASAHFPWLVIDDESHTRVFFGEGLKDQNYHLPETVAAAQVWQTDIDAPKRKVTTGAYEDEGFVGLRSDEPIEARGRLQTEVVYGVYHGSKLNYYAQCYPSPDAAAWPKSPAEELPLQVLLTVADESLFVTLLQDGKPASGASLTLTNETSKEGIKAETDAKGRVEYALDLLAEGRNGLMAMLVDKDASGEIDGKSYQSTTHILTVTFTGNISVEKTTDALPPLPEAVSSFGAAVADGWLYVYSGHIGKAHDHSRDNLSKHFRRLKLDGTTRWEELPMQRPLQGLAMVSHGGKLYRIGGLSARNKSGEEEDLHSVDSFARFDPVTKQWTALPNLPTGRSSHNAAVIGDTLYVVGGWRLHGDNEGDWQATALTFDLSDPDANWQEVAEPPFRRRALAVGHADGKLVVISGMTDDQDLSKDVFVFDPKSNQWGSGPLFPGNPFHGFGLAAWNESGTLYAGGMEGVLYCLSTGLKEWVPVTKLATPRFFHQLVPSGRGSLLAVAGASHKTGHLAEIEELHP